MTTSDSQPAELTDEELLERIATLDGEQSPIAPVAARALETDYDEEGSV